MSGPRNRISKSNGGISSENDLPRIVAAGAPYQLRVSPKELHELIVDAIIAYDVDVDLMPSNLAGLKKRRRELASAVERLVRLLSDPSTQDLLDLLRAYPATLAFLNQQAPSDLGRLPIKDLRRDLASLRTALSVRAFTDQPSTNGKSSRCPSFPNLIGTLADAFTTSFISADGGPARTGASFDEFARATLEAAGVRPGNNGRFGERAISDALGEYRRWQRAT